MKKILALLTIICMLLIPAAMATQDDGEAQISIDVSQQLWIDITPESMSWTGTVNPGSFPDCDAGSGCIGSNDLGTGATHEVYGVEVENIGSLNITHIWLNATVPGSNPFATGQTGKYDAGNMLAVSLSNASGFHFINRKEFAMPRKPIYLQVPAGVDDDKTGRLRSGNQERYWGIDPAASGKCNETGASFYITSGDVHNETQTGDIDMSGESANAISPCSGNQEFGCANTSTTINGETQDYAVLAYHDCSYVYFTRFNADLVGLGTDLLEDGGYIWDNDTRGQTFNPGNYTPIYVETRIPYGTSLGSLTTGYIRVFADDT